MAAGSLPVWGKNITSSTPTQSATIVTNTGKVYNCTKLNMRSTPKAIEGNVIHVLIDEKNKKIDSINEEIDAIERASESRKKNIQLEKDQYNLEKMLNQRTTSVYKEDVGFVFEADTTGIRDAREKDKENQETLQIDNLKNEISLIQKEIDLLEEKKDALTKEQDAIQQLMEESNKYYDNLIKQQEKCGIP